MISVARLTATQMIRGAALILGMLSALVAGIQSTSAAVQLSADDQAAVLQLNNYLNQIRQMKGEFTQTSPRGQVANGVFYISKPGKMRFEYAPPSPLLVVSDGSWVTVQNTKRKRDDQYPLSATPLKLVLSDQVNLLEQAVILNIEHKDDLAAITLQEKDQLVAGQLTMIFNRTSNELVQWIIVDGKGQQTTVELSNVENGTQANPALFVVKKFKKQRDRGNR